MDARNHFVRVSMNISITNIPATKIINQLAEFVEGIGWSTDGLEHKVLIDSLSVQEFDELEGGSDE